MKHSQYPLVFVQGPFGTGKTKFISTVLQVATIIRLSWMGCASSNPVVDLLAIEMERACPEMGAIRFHSLASEARALRRSEQQLAVELDLDKNYYEGSEDNYIVPIEEDAEEGKLFNAFMIDLTTKPQLWNPTRKERPNFKSMGLNIRALQNAGVLYHKVPAFDHGSENPHIEFCEGLHAQDFANPEAPKDYKDKEHELFLDTMRRAGGVCTTLSNSADKFLMDAKKIELVVIDEGAQSTELEGLLPWIDSCETVKLVIIVGDPKQLNATVKTADQNKRDEVVNPFASQLQLSMFERLRILVSPFRCLPRISE